MGTGITIIYWFSEKILFPVLKRNHDSSFRTKKEFL